MESAKGRFGKGVHRMSQIFDKAKREHIHETLCMVLDPGMTRDYVRALEQIAEAARNYADNTTPINKNKLDELLSKVDRMRP